MSLIFNHISFSYGRHVALSDINLTAKPGEILSLLGPSGCGKTTLLNVTAGIFPVQQGDIRLQGDILASAHINPPPEKRPVGLVFQDGALFPHLTAAQNISFGIKDKAHHKTITETLLEQIGLKGYGGRYPHTLSGGQQQRVALARALAPKPAVLLMDEPFANLDIMLRRQLREETRRILRDRNCITILVTHDPDEALEVSDSVAVMDQGKITQQGRPEELYKMPSSLTVAMLTGGGAVIPVVRKSEVLSSSFGDFPLSCLVKPSAMNSGQSGHVLARPLSLGLKPDPNGAVIQDIRRTGQSQHVTLLSDAGERLTLQMKMSEPYNSMFDWVC